MVFIKVLFITFFAFAGFASTDHLMTRWVITRGCSLRVDGSTNVNKFSCVISDINSPDTLTFIRRTDSESVNLSGSLKLDVRNFNCHNPVMTGDLRKTLKTKEFPNMLIRFISLSGYPLSSTKAYPLNGIVSIELAGITKKYKVAYTISPASKNTLMLTGVREINFSDFSIVPPRKIGGMIQTSDKLLAEFNLVLRLLN